MHIERVKRKSPSTETLRELYLRSGNQCAYPECNSPLINNEGKFIGQVCHIESAKEGGQRFNAKQSNEERRSYDNLMLMCYEHHKVTDDTAKFSVQTLKEMKQSHEVKFSDIVKKLKASITDFTKIEEINLPKNLKSLNRKMGWNHSDKELLPCIFAVTEYAKKLQTAPPATRKLYVIIVKRSHEIPGSYNRDKRGIALSEIKHACDLDYKVLREHIHILDALGLIKETDPEYFDGQEAISVSNLDGWPIATDLKTFSEITEIDLSLILADLHFDLLDE